MALTAPPLDGCDLLQAADPALAAYEPFAPFYDAFTKDYEYEDWLEAIETWAFAAGLKGQRLLDVACGTGKSFLPMLRKGYAVTACDLSPAMVARAQVKAANAANVVVADMRALPWRSRFDFITCLDDAINYLLTEDDLDAAVANMAGALRPGGVLVFDANTLATYRTTFARSFDVGAPGAEFRWCGEGRMDDAPGCITSATIRARCAGASISSRHTQRHWPVERLRSACRRASLERVAFRGQVPGGQLVGDPDEDLHTKVMCLAARRGASEEEVAL